MSLPILSLTPLRTALPQTTHDVETHVLLRVTVPEASGLQTQRLPLHLSLVLDRSGSMSGEPLEQAKRCAQFIVSGLRPTDRCSVVAYDNQATVLAPAQLVGDRKALQQAIQSIHSGGSTDLHAGWLAGATTLAPHTSPQVLSRVILLSDGCANHGLTDEAAIARQCAQLAEAGVTTSTYGLGEGFNESLMHAMARAGHGKAYYGETADDLMGPFTEELSLLDALAGRKVQLTLNPVDGVQLQVLNHYETTSPRSWRLPDLARGADTWALLRVRVSAKTDAAALFTAQVNYVDAQGERVHLEPLSLSLPRVSEALFAALPADDAVTARIAELGVAEVAQQTRLAIAQEDWPLADRLLQQLREQVAGYPWLSDVVAELQSRASQRDQQLFMKEAMYSASMLHLRPVMSHSESFAADYAVAESTGPVFLRRKAAQGKSPDSAAKQPTKR
jgi:Ca-activated chloride channel homolog